jgi:hypothetical protein
VGQIVNHGKHVLRALADTGASSSSRILVAYTLATFIKTHDNNTTTWSTIGGKFTKKNSEMLMTFSLPEFNPKKKMCSSLAFHVDDRSESSSTYDMIIGNGPRSSWIISHNHEL